MFGHVLRVFFAKVLTMDALKLLLSMMALRIEVWR